MADFITLHDVEFATKRHPEGHAVRVRALSVATLRPYETTRPVRTVVGIMGGGWIHASESEDEILTMINGVLR